MQEQTREILWNIPLWASAGIYLLLLAVLIIAVRRAFYYYSLWMKGAGQCKNRQDRPEDKGSFYIYNRPQKDN